MAAGLIDHLFLAHPRSAGQGYVEHLWFAWRFAGVMAAGAAAACLHGVFPSVCQTAASDRVRALQDRLTVRDDGGLMPDPLHANVPMQSDHASGPDN
jgi:Family of unknown function (DUF6356)